MKTATEIIAPKVRDNTDDSISSVTTVGSKKSTDHMRRLKLVSLHKNSHSSKEKSIPTVNESQLQLYNLLKAITSTTVGERKVTSPTANVPFMTNRARKSIFVPTRNSKGNKNRIGKSDSRCSPAKNNGSQTAVEVRRKKVDNGQSSPVLFPFDHYNRYVQAWVSVFKNLSVRDLLNVRLVCKSFDVVLRSPDVWMYARLLGCRLCGDDQWTEAVKFLKHRGAKTLDISEGGQGRSFTRQFTESALPAASRFLTGLHFGQVLPKLLESSASAFGKNLRSLTMTLVNVPFSKSISSSTFVSLAKCTELVELRLSAIDSTDNERGQRICITGEGLPALASLTKLRVLALFDFRAKDETVFEFLNSLTSLRVLEIGDCQSWTRKTYSKLSRLTELRRLRLEYFEPGAGSKAFVVAISGLKELREVEFVKYSLDLSQKIAKPLLALFDLPRLHTLRLYPDLNGKWAVSTWRRTIDVLPKSAGLKRMELGIVMEESPDLENMATSSKPPFICVHSRQPHRIVYLNKEALREWISEKLPNTVVKLVDCTLAQLASTRVPKWC